MAKGSSSNKSSTDILAIHPKLCDKINKVVKNVRDCSITSEDLQKSVADLFITGSNSSVDLAVILSGDPEGLERNCLLVLILHKRSDLFQDFVSWLDKTHSDVIGKIPQNVRDHLIYLARKEELSEHLLVRFSVLKTVWTGMLGAAKKQDVKQLRAYANSHGTDIVKYVLDLVVQDQAVVDGLKGKLLQQDAMQEQGMEQGRKNKKKRSSETNPSAAVNQPAKFSKSQDGSRTPVGGKQPGDQCAAEEASPQQSPQRISSQSNDSSSQASAAPSNVPHMAWTPSHVQEFILKVGNSDAGHDATDRAEFATYASTFCKERVTGSVLRDITREELIADYGVNAKAHIKTILTAIKKEFGLNGRT